MKAPYSGNHGATHLLTEPRYVDGNQVDFVSLANIGVPVLMPIYLNAFLTSDKPPALDEFLLPDYKPHWESNGEDFDFNLILPLKKELVPSNDEIEIIEIAPEKVAPRTSPRKKCQTEEKKESDVKKCRARYGLEQQDLWCKPCRRKKKCVRVQMFLDGASEQEIDNFGEEKPVKEVIESRRREDKSEELVVLEKPVFAEVFQGPFSCLVSGCGKIIQTEKEVSLHCNKLHLNTPVSELIFSDGSGKTLGLAHFYRNVLQCSICKTLR